MRYKFLFDIFKNSKEYKLFKSNKNTDDVQLDVYEQMVSVKMELETIYQKKFIIIDKFIDGIYLSKVLCNSDLNKIYKVLTKFIKSCSIEDFRILYLFRLKLYNSILGKEGPYVYCYLLPYVSLSVVCGGILYLPLVVDDKKITLGKELDELAKPEHFFDSRLVTVDERVFTYFRGPLKKEKVEVAKSFLKTSCDIINKYLDKLLSVYNSLYLENVNNLIKNFINLDLFKLSINDINNDIGLAIFKRESIYSNSNLVDLGLKRILNEFVEFKFSSLVTGCDFNGLRDRKFILPNKGVMLKCEEAPKNSSLVLEGYDELLGYYICQLVYNGKDEYFDMFLLKSSVSNVCDLSVSLLNLYNLYKINSPKSDFTEMVFSNTSEGFRMFDMDSIFTATYADTEDDMENIRYYNCICEKVTLEILQPTYWKYKDRNYNTNLKTRPSSDLFAEKMISIGAFKRRLPDGSQRGEQVEQLAEKYCINLKEGETIVSPFERRQKVKL